MVDHDEPRWSTVERKIVHRGRVTLVDHEVLLPDGSRSHFEVDESVPFSVATLVIDGADVLLSRQYRYPLDRWIYDLPGGGGHVGEEPIHAARRELEEELGVVPDDLRHLHTFSITPAELPGRLTCSSRPKASDLDVLTRRIPRNRYGW
ncbi:NUDIX hydrolase [Streptomyces sp. ISL-90]|nr:NUDIX hydrolase [Streptomyces sp. ISL-90]